MKHLYPASSDIPTLRDDELALKIARHSPCSACTSCPALHPPPGANVVSTASTEPGSSLGDLAAYGSDDDDGAQTTYLDTCACGHGVREHGADEPALGREEFARRGRVAVRLDELLQDVGKLLDFEYTDDDIVSLRLQMRLPVALTSTTSPTTDTLPSRGSSQLYQPPSPDSSDLSDIPPPTKKRRISRVSVSSLSEEEEEDDDDDEEDQPLASRMVVANAKPDNNKPSSPDARRPGQGAGKKTSSMKSKAQTAPASIAPPTGAEQALMNGDDANEYEAKIKVEDKMDEGQLSRLVTGVTVDAGGMTSAVPQIKTEKAASIELRKGVIRIVAVENDGGPRSLVILTGLKTLFQKQLPKMPREYIARLVYDTNSRCLAIVKRGYKVVGGICFRPFPHRGFAEIVFFATASVDQVKGYGGMLMDHFKTHIQQTYPGMLHFLTYADNYAVGYFKKQGFSKDITLERAVWAGYIKDYEGGTIMQCTMLGAKVDYLRKAETVAVQREAILTKIREMSRSHVVYEGLKQFGEGEPEGVSVDPRDVPGLRESGWTPEMATNVIRTVSRGAEYNFMQRLLHDLQNHPSAWAFLQPVNGEEVADYYDVIKQPMDFNTMEHKLETNQYPFLTAMVDDAQLVFDNCRLYNPEGSVYAKNATRMEKFLRDKVAERLQQE